MKIQQRAEVEVLMKLLIVIVDKKVIEKMKYIFILIVHNCESLIEGELALTNVKSCYRSKILSLNAHQNYDNSSV